VGVEERLLGAVRREHLVHEPQRRERDLALEPLAQVEREVRHLVVRGRAAGRPLPHLAGAETRLPGRGEAIVEQLQVHAEKKSGARACDSRASGNTGCAVNPSVRHTIPVSGDSELLDAVLDAAASLILVVDARGRLVRWNRACEELLGYSAAELDGPDALLDLIPADEQHLAEDATRALRAGRSPVRAEFHWRTRDGDLRLVEWSTTALIGPDGEVTYLVGTGIDVTDARQMEVERAAAEVRLRHMADHDALTGLLNRRRFEEELDRHIAHGRRYGMDGALLLLDLDDFKRVNDEYGHRAGDCVLTTVAEVLNHRLRESDIVARFGGDEFAVLMPVGGVPEATELAELLGAAIRAEVPTPAGPLTASVGIALFRDLTTADEVLSRADDAMYAEKRGEGRAVRHLRSVE
jgi:diguanylate cyclase (GGDEF)-like protein/PAS domain S-box-containing protein